MTILFATFLPPLDPFGGAVTYLLPAFATIAAVGLGVTVYSIAKSWLENFTESKRDSDRDDPDYTGYSRQEMLDEGSDDCDDSDSCE